jgi:hypothetical protein
MAIRFIIQSKQPYYDRKAHAPHMLRSICAFKKKKKKKKTIKIEDGQRLTNKFKNIKLLYVLFEEKEVRCFALWPLWLGATPPLWA